MAHETTTGASRELKGLALVLRRDWDLSIHLDLSDDLREEVWDAYESSFEIMRTKAVQRHLMTRDEFEAVIDDPRLDKIIVRERGGDRRIAAYAAMTTDLAAWPLLSADYFHERWPEQFEAGHIWYTCFVAVPPAFQRSSVLGAVVHHQVDVASRVGGVVGLDTCDFNEEQFALASSILRIGSRFSPGSKLYRLDAQTFWGYEVTQVPLSDATQ